MHWAIRPTPVFRRTAAGPACRPSLPHCSTHGTSMRARNSRRGSTLAAACSAAVPCSSQSSDAQRASDIREARALAGMFELLDQEVDLAQKLSLVKRQGLRAQGPRQFGQAPLVRTPSPRTNFTIAKRGKVRQIELAPRVQHLRGEIFESEKKAVRPGGCSSHVAVQHFGRLRPPVKHEIRVPTPARWPATAGWPFAESAAKPVQATSGVPGQGSAGRLAAQSLAALQRSKVKAKDSILGLARTGAAHAFEAAA